MPDPSTLDDLIASVTANARYQQIDPALVRRVGAEELSKRRNLKEAIKTTRAKLHQIGGAYQEKLVNYPRWTEELSRLPNTLESPALRGLCRSIMQEHTSTRERLPILDAFFTECLASVAPVRSILDLACGLNPLALPWIPLAPGAGYYACDIYQDMVGFINHFLGYVHQPGKAELCDLTQDVPPRRAQVALLLKTLPCLEQIDKNIGLRLLESVQAEYILVSFPVSSLGGRGKGMRQNYETHFHQLVAGRGWPVQAFEFATELAFLVHKGVPQDPTLTS